MLDAKNKIKIAYILPAPAGGGAEKFTLDLLNNLDKDRFSLTVVFYKRSGFFYEDFKNSGAEIIMLPERRRLSFLNFFKLVKALKIIKPDIVHTQLGGDYYGFFAGRLAGIKQFVSTLQNVEIGQPFFRRFLVGFCLRRFDKIVAISKAVAADAKIRYRLKIPPIIIYNGLEIDKFLNNNRLYQKKEIITIGSVGRLVSQKNFPVLISALAKIKDRAFVCLLVGEGPDKDKLQTLINQADLDKKILLLGRQKNIKAFLDSLDVFVLPSAWEGLGIAALEAGLNALPVIVSDVDGLKEVVTDGEDGWYFKSNDSSDLANKITYLLDNLDNPEIETKAKKLQAKIKTNFAIEKITHDYEKLYFSL